MISHSLRLFLLRHGNTFNAGEVAVQIGSKTDLALTDKGKLQAAGFAQHLKTHALVPAAIYCGSLARQLETAKIIHAVFPSTPLFTQQSALDEIDYGAWEGLSAQAIAQQWPQEYQDWCEQGIWPSHLFHSQKAVHIEKLQQWLNALEQNFAPQSLIIAVSSNGLMRMLLNFMPDLWNSLVAAKKMDSYKVGTGHYCDLRLSQGQPLIQQWNCAVPLPEPTI